MNDRLHSAYDDRLVLEQCLDVISTSPSGQRMLDEAMEDGWRIDMDDLESSDYALDWDRNVLLLDSQGLCMEEGGSFRRSFLILALARALRDIWQEKRHGAMNDSFGPEEILMVERMRLADCNVLAVLVAWELRGEGHGDIWRYLIGSDEGDIAVAFSHYLEQNPVTLDFNAALATAFRRWYLCEARVNACDHDTLEYIDRIAESGKDFSARKKLSRFDVEVLSCLPDRSAYLHGAGETILSDPLYAGMIDPINQTHLLHIMRDLEVVRVGGVEFRDSALAAKIFPEEFSEEGFNRRGAEGAEPF